MFMFKRKRNNGSISDQDYALRKEEELTFMCMKSSGQNVLRFALSARLVRSLIVLTVVSLFVLAYGLWFSYSRLTDYRELGVLRKTVTVQEDSLQDMEMRFEALTQSVEDLILSESQLRQKLKLQPASKKKNGRRLSSYQREAESFRKDVEAAFRSKSTTIDQVSAGLAYVQSRLLELNLSVLEIQKEVVLYEDRYQSLPTNWPVYGNIRSDFGMRTHPVTGQKQLHKGIDIPSWIGAPVQSTADGVVEFGGWTGGYGWLVIVLHDYGGYRTFYAHMSELLVSRGMRVSKGQVIGRVGNTGMTTGPHLHYEIRRYTQALSPRRYLGLDLFTAGSRMW